MSSFTCISCRVAFTDADAQRAHYKTDWHRYNLKRKVAELPPVTAENFVQRVLAQRAQANDEMQDKSTHCKICKQHFGSQNAYDNHVKSKKHRESEIAQLTKIQKKVRQKNVKNKKLNEESAVVASGSGQGSSSAEVAGSSGQGSSSAEVAGNSGQGSSSAVVVGEQGSSGHTMSSKHNQSCSNDDDDDSTSDVQSVESWEGEALGEEECLFCSRLSDSLEQNVQHMTTSHSFFIPDVDYLIDLPGLITYLGEKVGEFHVCLWCGDRGKTYASTKSAQQHMTDKGHCKLDHDGDAVLEYADFYDYRSSYPEGYGEFDATRDSEDDEEQEVDVEELDVSNFQLVLPSGASVGHRSLQKYYKQKLKPTRVPTKTSLNNVITHYKALGWTGTTGAAAQKKAKDVAYADRMRSRFMVKLGMKSNNQKHFRPQVVF